MNKIKRAGFGRDDVSAVESAKREGPPPKRVAHRDQLPFAHDQERKRALNPAQSREHIGAIVRRLREQMQNDLAIGGRLEN